MGARLSAQWTLYVLDPISLSVISREIRFKEGASMPRKNDKHRYRKKTVRLDSEKSFFDKYPTLVVNRYWIPNAYLDAVNLTLQLHYESRFSFNRSVDQASAVYPNLNRNKIAEHALKWIANDY